MDLFLKFDRYIVYAVLAIVLTALLSIHRDFGISWDEAIQREHGIVTTDYINETCGNCLTNENLSDSILQEYKWRYYGTAFQAVSLAVEKKLNIEKDNDKFYLRHKIQIVYFCIALFFFYLLLVARFNNKILAILGLLLLLTTPRILGHQFYNPKDAIFLSGYIIACSTLVRFLKKPTILQAILHGIATGMVIDIRILGVYILPLTIGAFLLTRILGKNNKIGITPLIVYPAVSFIVMVLLWPYLWEAPISNLKAAFNNMSAFDWKGEVFFGGEYILATEVPPLYTWNWLSVSTPILTLGTILLGFFVLFYYSIKHFKRNYKSEPLNLAIDITMIMGFLGPLVSVIVFKSTLYDGWRQMLFIYPPMLYFSIRFIYAFSKSKLKIVSNIGYTIGGLIVLIQFYTVFRWHPMQNVYFNGLAMKPWVENYDLDYWGQGYKHAYTEFASTIESGKRVKISAANYPGWESYIALPKSTKEKLKYEGNLSQSDYYISNFRFEWEVKRHIEGIYPLNNPIHYIKKDGQILYGVYDLRESIKK